MTTDYFVLLLFWFIIPLMLWIVTPRNRLREVIATFLFFQMLTWLFSIGLTYTGLLESPIRLFKKATKISFTSEYLIFPFFAVLFQIYFPNKPSFVRRFFHYLFWVSIILLFMFLLGKLTNIMKVEADNLIRSFFNFIIELWLCHRYVLWLIQFPRLREIDTNDN